MSDAASWTPLFPDEEIPHILEAVLRCMSGLSKQSQNELETSLSKRLTKSLQRDQQVRNRPFNVSRENVIDDDDSDAEGRLDIVFTISTGCEKPWPYFAIEAKRLHVTFSSKRKSLVSEYLGKQGMLCFITGRYSTGLASGAMLGYVFDGNITGAQGTISAQIKKLTQSYSQNHRTNLNRHLPSIIHKFGKLFMLFLAETFIFFTCLLQCSLHCRFSFILAQASPLSPSRDTSPPVPRPRAPSSPTRAPSPAPPRARAARPVTSPRS